MTIPYFLRRPSRVMAASRLFAAALLGFALVVGGLGSADPARAAPITVTDMRDRTVTIPAPAKRIVLAEGRHILTLALLDKDPVSLVAAWGNDLRRFSPETFEALKARFPRTAEVPEVGGFGPNGGFSMEAVIAAKPDLVIFTMYGPVPQGIEKLDAAKVPYVFVDFFQKPLEKTVPSMRMLGTLLDREKQAEAFISFYEQHMGTVAARIEKLDRPAVFFHLNPDGKDCCFTSGPGNMSDFIAAAGGRNIGADKVPGSIGKLSLEYILSRDPDFYLAGGGSTVALDGLKIGPDVPKAVAEETMAKVLATPGIANLRAIREKRAGGIWLFFFDNPLFFVGVEAMARMIHPAAFADLDPDRTLEELNAHSLAFPVEGTFWVGARSDAR